MESEIVFGDRWIRANFPDTARIVSPGYGLAKLEPAPNQEKAIGEGVHSPLDLPPLSDFVKKDWKITIAFDDPTVPCYGPVWVMALRYVLDELRKAGVSKDSIKLVCANALHRKFRPSELGKIIGDEIINTFPVFCHDAEDGENIVILGETAEGYPVEVNRALVDSDLTIYINVFASAFNGGWKSICVGLSTWNSIRCHHTPEKMSMSMERNPMHEILNKMGEVVKSELKRDVFKIETVMANPFQVSRVFSGTIDACRKEVMKIWKKRAKRRRDLLNEKVDIVCYGVPNWSPYAAFSKMNPLLTLISTGLGYLGGVIEGIGKRGCDVVMATPCPNEWDLTAHASYPEVWKMLGELRDPDEIMERYERYFATHKEYIAMYRHNYAFHPVHGLMATFPLKRLDHTGRIIVAGIEEPELAEHLGFMHAPSIEEAIKIAQQHHGRDASIAVVKYPLMLSRQ